MSDLCTPPSPWLQQAGSPGPHNLLLQYVIFPYGDTLKSELWVEPQYGEVLTTPPGLHYLQGLTCSEISSKVLLQALSWWGACN